MSIDQLRPSHSQYHQTHRFPTYPGGQCGPGHRDRHLKATLDERALHHQPPLPDYRPISFGKDSSPSVLTRQVPRTGSVIAGVVISYKLLEAALGLTGNTAATNNPTRDALTGVNNNPAHTLKVEGPTTAEHSERYGIALRQTGDPGKPGGSNEKRGKGGSGLAKGIVQQEGTFFNGERVYDTKDPMCDKCGRNHTGGCTISFCDIMGSGTTHESNTGGQQQSDSEGQNPTSRVGGSGDSSTQNQSCGGVLGVFDKMLDFIKPGDIEGCGDNTIPGAGAPVEPTPTPQPVHSEQARQDSLGDQTPTMDPVSNNNQGTSIGSVDKPQNILDTAVKILLVPTILYIVHAVWVLRKIPTEEYFRIRTNKINARYSNDPDKKFTPKARADAALEIANEIPGCLFPLIRDRVEEDINEAYGSKAVTRERREHANALNAQQKLQDQEAAGAIGNPTEFARMLSWGTHRALRDMENDNSGYLRAVLQSNEVYNDYCKNPTAYGVERSFTGRPLDRKAFMKELAQRRCAEDGAMYVGKPATKDTDLNIQHVSLLDWLFPGLRKKEE